MPNLTNPEQTLEATRTKLAAWRRANKAPTPIPDDIWRSAVELSHHFGLGPVSRELRVSLSSGNYPPRTQLAYTLAFLTSYKLHSEKVVFKLWQQTVLMK